MRYIVALLVFATACAPTGHESGRLDHDCPIMDTGTEPGIVIVEPPKDAVVLAWECAAPDVDCVSATTGLDERGIWRASCSGDDSRPVLVVRWWVSL